ncbi:uncharacterized protein LOC126622911 [Malus sylvestris]|nr:uncharacterized protein LOC126622911 [Malus sylvestris]
MQTSLKLASFAITTYYLLLLLPLVGCSFHEDVNQHSSHNNIKENIHKLSPRMTSNVTVHGLLAWFSIGFLMPLGILVIRMSVREERGTTRAKVLFYLHVILQMLSVLVATAGAVMSLRNFENSFNNHHQRLGLALYGSIWIQTLIGFFRPHRGKKEWSFWYLAHWMLGTMISLFGIINIYTGLEAYHKRTQRSSGLWTILFTAQVSFIAACYLFQDKRDYIQKQGVISNLEQPITIRQQDEETAQRQQQIQRDLLPDQQPCGKVNALKNLFDSTPNSFVGPDGKVYHSHDGLAPHSHEPIYSPGYFSRRAPPLLSRNFNERAFTIGIGGPVGTGKTALMLALCKLLRDKYSLAAVTNDIFTKEDGEFLVKNGALPEERIRAVETGGCPHAAIREDISINLGPLEELSNLYKTDILLCESGGDNLAANFSRELADYIIYIIDVSGGDKIPRKGGPGITQADLLVINKTDLAPAVGADLAVMERDALRMRDGGPFVFAQVKHGKGVEEIVNHILQAWEFCKKERKKIVVNYKNGPEWAGPQCGGGVHYQFTTHPTEEAKFRESDEIKFEQRKKKPEISSYQPTISILRKMAAEDEEPKKRRMVVESLGWLTESSIMPKKHRAIAGVGASSIMELKAQLYQSQEESKKSKELASSDIEFHRAKKRITAHDGFSAKNSGVDARAHKDKLELKAVHDGSASYAALERKAALYDKLARGELSDEEDKEKYCVDFFGKRVEQDEPQQTQHRDSPAVVSPENQDGEINASTLFSTKPLGLGRADATVDNDIHKRFVREVHEEANQAREMASKLKLRREEQAAARREKLKQAYIRKQLERLKTASCNKEQTE